jgi:DNA-binding transcriptional LysR family regulator
LTQVRTFLVLADELHFGRAAERLGLSQPRVSRLIAALEREVGGALFDRTTRRVRLTPLGMRLHEGWRPAHEQLLAALDDARTAARQPEGTLRIGFTLTTGGTALTRLVRAFTTAYPACAVQLRETAGPRDLYGPLRTGDIDVLISWLVVDEPDLTAGPAIEYRARALAVSRDHPLTTRGSVSVEDLADYETAWSPPLAVFEAIVPPRTPSGRAVRRTRVAGGLHEVFALVASGEIVHPTAAGLPLAQRGDITLLPLTGLPPLRLGPIWCTAHENARITALAEVAATLARSCGEAGLPASASRSRDASEACRSPGGAEGGADRGDDRAAERDRDERAEEAGAEEPSADPGQRQQFERDHH